LWRPRQKGGKGAGLWVFRGLEGEAEYRMGVILAGVLTQVFRLLDHVGREGHPAFTAGIRKLDVSTFI
jgi:hypothetical protein